MTLCMAVVGGPMYDDLYRQLPFDAELVVHADHPTLNREVATRLDAGEPFDIISTHGKYAPSQRAWLHRLDDLVSPAVLAELSPRCLDLCRFADDLLCLPRNVDVRVLWWRTDLMDRPPASWPDVIASGLPFGFTGRESGLFGLYYELVVASGGTLFTDDGTPTLDGHHGRDAVETILALAAAGPPDLADWHYDEVDDALLDGRVAMAATWPGGFARIRHSDHYPVLAPATYPGGRSYSGCHGWAIPRTCPDVDRAVEALTWLASAEAALLDSATGNIPAHLGARAALTPVDDTDAVRLEVTTRTVDEAMMTYPALTCFPAIEDAGWAAIHHAIQGRLDPSAAVATMQAAAIDVIDEARR